VGGGGGGVWGWGGGGWWWGFFVFVVCGGGVGGVLFTKTIRSTFSPNFPSDYEVSQGAVSLPVSLPFPFVVIGLPA